MDRNEIRNYRSALEDESAAKKWIEVVRERALKVPSGKLRRIREMSLEERGEYVKRLRAGTRNMLNELVEAPATTKVRSELETVYDLDSRLEIASRRINTSRVGNFSVGRYTTPGISEPDKAIYYVNWLLSVGGQEEGAALLVLRPDTVDTSPPIFNPEEVRDIEERAETIQVICAEAGVTVEPVVEPLEVSA